MDYQKEILENQKVIMRSLISLLIQHQCDINYQIELSNRYIKTKEILEAIDGLSGSD